MRLFRVRSLIQVLCTGFVTFWPLFREHFLLKWICSLFFLHFFTLKTYFFLFNLPEKCYDKGQGKKWRLFRLPCFV